MELSGKTILITGIGGFIGLRTAELAIKQGMKVKGLQRSEDKAKKAQDLGAEVMIGSVTDPVAAQKACQGVDIVLHTAAIAKEGGSLAQFREVNVGGTVNMAKTAVETGVKAFVHLSSAIVYGFTYLDHVTEEGSIKVENNPYSQTKIEAEQELLKLTTPSDFGIIIIRPGDVYGPGSPSWVVRPLELMRKKMFLLANGGRGVINHIYLDNLVDLIFLALEKEAYCEVFNATDGQETSWQEYFARLAAIAGLPKPLSLPANLLKFLIKLRGLGQKALGQEVDTLPEAIDYLTRPYAYSVEKAKTKLGYEPKISLEEGWKLTEEWLQSKSNGYRL